MNLQHDRIDDATGDGAAAEPLSVGVDTKEAGSVYFTSKSLPNPYGDLPTYWNQEVSAAASAK